MEEMPQTSIKNTVVELLGKMGFEASAEVTAAEGTAGTFLCAVSVEQGQNFLIGQYGVNLAALQHLVRVMLRKQAPEHLNVIVDVNGYLAEKKASLEKEAEQAAQEALRNNTSVTLRPMLPYERKIVHSFFTQDERVATASVGEGRERKVVIRPKPLTSDAPEAV